MPLKINISDKGKSWKLEIESEAFVGTSVGDKIKGQDLNQDLEGYELEITGASDMAGFPHKKDVEGPELRKILLTKGWGMRDNSEGIRRKRSVRGKQLSEKTIQINIIVSKHGSKKLEEIFPEQNKPKAKKEVAPAA